MSRDFRQRCRSWKTVKIAVLWLCSIVALATPAWPQGTFTSIDAPGAGTMMPEGTVGMSVNGEGDITGIFIDASFVAHGFLLPATANGSIISFDAPFAGTGPGQGTFPIRINDSGIIVGTYFDANYIDHGFIRAADGTIDTFEVASSALTMDRGTYPDGIDAAGDVAGFWKDSTGNRHGFVRAANGAVTTFDVSGAGTGSTQGTVPISMNASGVITGVYVDSNGVDHGFTRAANGAITTFDCPGAETTVGSSKDLPIYGTLPTSINATGEVTGIYMDASGIVHGFALSAGGAFTYPIDAPGAGTGAVIGGKVPGGTYPFSINTAGVIAGAYIDSSGVLHGFVLSPNGTFTAPLDDPNAGATSTGLIPGTGALNMNDSGVLTGGYFDANGVAHGFALTLTPTAMPTFSIPAGTYTSAQSVTISDATAGAAIYYTTDGTTPATASTQYTGAIAVSSTETLQAIALAPGNSVSAVAIAAYTINISLPTASAAPASLTFPSQTDGTTSATQTVIVTNTGSANLTFAAGAITIAGANAADFAVASDACSGASVAANGTCAVGVTFKPSINGSEAATLNIADNASNSPQTVSLSGTGVTPPTFTISSPSGSSTTSTVPKGGTATYTLSLAPVSGFNQPITFTCSGAPSEANCSVSPNPVTLNGTSATTVTVSVTTTAPSLTPVGPDAPSPWQPEHVPLALGLFALMTLAIAAWAARRRWMPALSVAGATRLRRAMWVAMLLGVATFAACGGGGSNNKSSNPGTPAGAYTLIVTGTSGTQSHSTTLTLTVN